MPSIYHATYKQYFQSLSALDLGCGGPDTAEELEKAQKTFKLIAADTDVNAEPIDLGKRRIVRCFRTVHRVEAVAYCLFEQKRSLKAHMRGKSNEEIRDAAMRGEEVSDTVTAPLVAYSGDTTIDGVLQHDTLLHVPILIVECTIWDDSLAPQLTAERGHIHLQHLNDHADRFNNKHIVLTHCSPRHNPAQLSDVLDQSRFASVMRAKGTSIYIL